jgi:hypothetical protein
MDTFERNGARMLAVSFNAYCEARDKGEDQRLMFWGKRLLEAQRAIGIELLTPNACLYPLHCDDKTRAQLRADVCYAPDDSAPRDSMGARLDGGADDAAGPGGALVPAPKPQPRKPSPGVADAARAFYATR